MADPPRVLVTGAAGFVGANLARFLRRDGFEVQLLLRNRENTWRIESLLAEVPAFEADLTDRAATVRAVRAAQPDWVFHCAVYGAYSWQNDFERMVRSNLLGTAHLLEVCLEMGVSSFINTSSSSEYGFRELPPGEDAAPRPNSDYAVTKASATLYCRFVGESRGVPVRTLRLYSVYGPYEDPDRLVPTLIRHGLAGRLPPLVDPDVARDFVWVEDVYSAYRSVAESSAHDWGAIYNVGTGVQLTMREVVEIARRVMGIADTPVWGTMPNRRWDSARWVADARRLREVFGWEPRVGFEEGFRRTADWQRTAGDAAPRALSSKSIW